jgi:ribosome modulation factor
MINKATQRPNSNSGFSSKKQIRKLEEQATTEELYVISCGINILGAFRIKKQAQVWVKNIGTLHINNSQVYPSIEQLHCIVGESHREETAKPVGRVGECFIGYCIGFNDQLWSIPLMGERHPLYKFWDEGFTVGYQESTTKKCPYTEPTQAEAWKDGREEGIRRAGVS